MVVNGDLLPSALLTSKNNAHGMFGVCSKVIIFHVFLMNVIAMFDDPAGRTLPYDG